MTTPCLAQPRGKRQQKKGAVVHLPQREESFPARNSRLLFQPGCFFAGGAGAGGKGGMLLLAVNACVRECTVASTSHQPHQQRRGD